MRPAGEHFERDTPPEPRVFGSVDHPHAPRAESLLNAEVPYRPADELPASDGRREVFAQLCENLWRGLPRFRWESSIRTWLYTLARHAAHAFRRDPHRRRRVGMSEHPEIAEIEAHVRTTTVTYLRSEVKDRVTRLRESLDPDEQMLLILRIDRQMAWTDIARILGGETLEAESRQAATLRKRFERLKERLRSLAASPTEAHAN